MVAAGSGDRHALEFDLGMPLLEQVRRNPPEQEYDSNPKPDYVHRAPWMQCSTIPFAGSGPARSILDDPCELRWWLSLESADLQQQAAIACRLTAEGRGAVYSLVVRFRSTVRRQLEKRNRADPLSPSRLKIASENNNSGSS